jgi:hypothetical protein
MSTTHHDSTRHSYCSNLVPGSNPLNSLRNLIQRLHIHNQRVWIIACRSRRAPPSSHRSQPLPSPSPDHCNLLCAAVSSVRHPCLTSDSNRVHAYSTPDYNLFSTNCLSPAIQTKRSSFYAAKRLSRTDSRISNSKSRLLFMNPFECFQNHQLETYNSRKFSSHRCEIATNETKRFIQG